MDAGTKKQLSVWLISGCLLIFAMVIIGGITRLTDSGLSIVEWKPITGVLPPLTQEAWEKVFLDYQQFPEFKIRNHHYTLDEFKSIFWWEYLHRNMGRLIGLVFIIPFIYFFRKRVLDRVLVRRLLILFGLGGFQGFLGWFMVSSGLQREPDVSHYRLAMHLLAALASVSYAFWLLLDINRKEEDMANSGSNGLRQWTMLLLGVLLVQICYGAFVAGLKAGLIYNTWPLMGDEIMPASVTSTVPWWKNWVEGLAGIQFLHRWIAFVVAALSVLLYFKARKLKTARIGYAAAAILVAVGIQLALGVLTLINAVPIALGVMHQSVAIILWLLVLRFLFLISPRPSI